MKILQSIIIGFLLVACERNSINTEQDYFRWLSDKSNHLSISKTVSDVKMTVKYLPPEYLTFNELKNRPYDKTLKDSLLMVYQQNRTFLLSFSSDKDNATGNSPDVMYHDISNLEEYNQRFEDLTFNIGNYIKLKTDSNIYIPILHVFENTYGISPYRSIYLVFGKKGLKHDDLLSSNKYELVFNDLIFSTGISYFSFDKKRIDNIPHINFWKR
ncbi:MAG TPA: hypothetical protein VIH57_16495 [Bacteroidales bacterium]